MRMMVTLRIPVETGTRAIKDGSLPRIVQQITERIRPECAYFMLEGGQRTMRAVFDLKNTSDMVPNFEAAMMGLDAHVELTPVMTADDLAAGMKGMS
jgi:hypothetical protein